MSIIKTIPYKAIKIAENLNEYDAFQLEVLKIREYRSKGEATCNFTDGGDGKSGCVCSDETKAKMRQSHKIRRFKHTETFKRHMTEVKKEVSKKIKHLNSGVIFNSIKEAARTLGLAPANIRGVLSNKSTHTKNQSFELVEG